MCVRIHVCMYTRTRARARTHTHTHTHTNQVLARALSGLGAMRELTISSGCFDGDDTQDTLWTALSNMPRLQVLCQA